MAENTKIFCSILGIGSHAINVLQELPLEKAGLNDVIFLGVGNSQRPSSDKFEFLEYDGSVQTSEKICGAAEVFFYRSPLALCCVDIDTEVGLDLLGRISPILKNMARPKLFVLFHQDEELSESAREAIVALKRLHDNVVIFSGSDCNSQVVDYTLLSLLAHQLCHLHRQGDSGYVETLISSGVHCRTIGHYADDFINLPQIMEQHGEMQLSSNESIIFFWLIGEDFNEEEHQACLEEVLIRKGWQLERCFIEIIHMKDWRDSFVLSEIAVSLFKQKQAKRPPSTMILPIAESGTSVEKQDVLNFETNEEVTPVLFTETQSEEKEEVTLMPETSSQCELPQEALAKETSGSDEPAVAQATLLENGEEKVADDLVEEILEPSTLTHKEKADLTPSLAPVSEIDELLMEEDDEEVSQSRPMWKELSHFFHNISKKNTHKDVETKKSEKAKKSSPPQQELGLVEYSRGIFEQSPINSWNGENLDIPTYLRQNITLYADTEE